MKKSFDIDIDKIFGPVREQYPQTLGEIKVPNIDFKIDSNFNFFGMVEEDVQISLADIEKDKNKFCFSRNKKIYVVYKKDNCGLINKHKSAVDYNPDKPIPPYIYNKIHLKYCANIEEHATLKDGLIKTFRVNAQKKFPVLIGTNPNVEVMQQLSVCQTCIEEMSSVLEYIDFPLLKYRSQKDGKQHWDGMNFNLMLYAKKMAEHPELLSDQVRMEELHGENMDIGYNNQSHRAVKRLLIKRYGYVCAKCNVDLTYTPYLISLHHKNRKKYENTLENCELLCALCHFEGEHEGDIPADQKAFILKERKKSGSKPAVKKDIIVLEELKKAIELKRKGLYRESLVVYQGISPSLCSKEELVNLYYGLGKLYYILEEYPQALQQYLSCICLEVLENTPDINTYIHFGYTVFAYLHSKGDTSSVIEGYFPSITDYRMGIDPHFAQNQDHTAQKTLVQDCYAALLAFETIQIINNIFGTDTLPLEAIQDIQTDLSEQFISMGYNFFSMEVAQIISFARIWKKKFLQVNAAYRQNVVMDLFPEQYFTGYGLYLGLSTEYFFEDGQLDEDEQGEIEIRSFLAFQSINELAMASFNSDRAVKMISQKYKDTPEDLLNILEAITNYSSKDSEFFESENAKSWGTAYGIMMYFSVAKFQREAIEHGTKDWKTLLLYAVMGYKAFVRLKSNNYSLAKALNQTQEEGNEGLVEAIKVLKTNKDSFFQEIKAHTIK